MANQEIKTQFKNVGIINDMFVLILGDSLSMSYRKVGVEITDTYSYTLQRYLETKYSDVYVKTVNLTGTPIKVVLEQVNSWLLPNLGDIDLTILQFGIVDGAPRPIPQVVRTALTMSPPIIRNSISKLLHDYRRYIQNEKHPFRNTHKKMFERCYGELLNTLSSQSKLVIVLSISPGKPYLYRHSPGLERSISEYNQIINNLSHNYTNVKYVDLVSKLSKEPELYLTDDLHIKKPAHAVISEEIIKLI